MLTLSFFECVLPGVQTKEGRELAAKLTLGNSNSNEEVFNRILQLTELLLKIAQETGEAIENNQYKDFDALVGNFGCQITAFDLQRKMRDLRLREEAVQVCQLARKKMEGLQQSLREGTFIIHLPLIEILKPNPCFQLTMLQILKQRNLDFSISSELKDLLRFRLLKLVNDNKMEGNLEVPFTNVSRLFIKVENLSRNKKSLKLLIDAIQLEESERAAFVIRQAASKMNIFENPRTGIIQRFLDKKFERKSNGIVSLPLVYNTEACLRNYQGIVLIKNKLSNCSGKIEGAVSQSVFMRMPEEDILDDQEISSLNDQEPLIVLEGIVMNRASLDETIKEVGLIQLILSNCADGPQYANLKKGDPGIIEDQDAQLEIEKLKGLNLKETKFNLDHFYCASVGEER